MPDYQALTGYLRSRQEPVVTMTFAEIERVVGQLPSSAKEHRAWWANSTTAHDHARYWIDAHRQATPDFNSRLVRFTLGGNNVRGPNGNAPGLRTSRLPRGVIK